MNKFVKKQNWQKQNLCERKKKTKKNKHRTTIQKERKTSTQNGEAERNFLSKKYSVLFFIFQEERKGERSWERKWERKGKREREREEKREKERKKERREKGERERE